MQALELGEERSLQKPILSSNASGFAENLISNFTFGCDGKGHAEEITQ